MFNRLTKCTAFTLAEVLITLGIIGVIAAMTIPTLISNYQISQLEVKLKKTYSTIQNGFKNLIAYEGAPLNKLGIFGDYTREEFDDAIDSAVRKVFKVAKTCKRADADVCQSYTVYPLRTPNGTTYVEFGSDRGFIVYFQDGVIMRIINRKCAKTNYSEASQLKHTCAWMIVDLNGQLGPNTLGKDVFSLGNLDENGNIYPDYSLEYAKSRANTDTYYWRKAKNACGLADSKLSESSFPNDVSGQSCLARIIENDWKMDYLH